MLFYWGEAVTPNGFGLKADSVKLTDFGIGHITSKSRIRSVCPGKRLLGFIRGDGNASVLRLNTSKNSMTGTLNGQLFTWGENSNGQLGLGKSEPSSRSPQPLKSLCGIPLAQISAGGDHSFALSLSGVVFGWGRNSSGQLGLGHTENMFIPTCVTYLSQKKTISISCGEEHTATLSKGLFRMALRRTAILEDSFLQLRDANMQALKGWLQVVYCENFEPSDVNKKDFFHNACKMLLDPESKMFMYNDAKTLIWFPVELSLPEDRYFFLGLLCGLAFYNNSVVHIPFPLALFKKLLDVRLSLEDLIELSPVEGGSLQYVLDYSDDDVDNMGMIYTIMWNNKQIELDPNEPEKAVTSLNKKDFVDRFVDYALNKSVERTFQEFKRGFYKVCDRNMVSLFQPEELRGVMLGSEEYDWNLFKQNTIYEWEFNKEHPTIVLFWEVFEELSAQDKRDFLLFLTGFDRVPVLGMAQLRMTVRPLLNSTQDHLPQALTCHSILDLPIYRTKEIFQRKLTKAIHHKRGFWED
ncbi:E3 ISG15--protein ligase HERC5 [Bagarius yarrelli]|uniref:E3 ISG15--protein ligase HERC5 n=1 Tax=Bagarius yarrelli TaxID=175774 RepID=A0A556TM99_BAGYA|nr:E3 ISG15--protein ligase HERC5 [Bagarius yarrelli]